MYAFDLSYDPRDPVFDIGQVGEAWAGVGLSLQLFTTENVYGVDPARTAVTADGSRATITADGLSWAGQQRRSEGRIAGSVEAVADGTVHITVAAAHHEPIKAVKVVLRGLPAEALAAGWWQATSPAGARRRPGPFDPIRWRYPWPDDDPWPEWETRWACAGKGDGAHVCLSVRDPEVRATRLFVHSPPWAEGDTLVEVVWEESALRWGTEAAMPPVRVHLAPDRAGADSDWKAHRRALEGPFGLVPWEERTDVPAWFRDVDLIVNLHGQHWTGYVFNTFDRMIDALGFVTRTVSGERILAYLPGWEGRYYHAYPWYRPSDDLGGHDGFVRFVAAAHDLGVHVMPMFGMHGANAARYPDWERAAFRTRTDRMVTLVNKPDWDGDRSGEDDQVFLNPGEPGFRDHLTVQVASVVETYGVDGVFLDTSACWFNDPRHDLVEGYRALVGALRRRYPSLLVAGEGWYDALLGIFPVNQSWLGTDRVMEHPDLLTTYGRAVGHLSVGAPGPGSTGVHEGGFYPVPDPTAVVAGHVPTLAVVGDTLTRYAAETAAFLDHVARRRG